MDDAPSALIPLSVETVKKIQKLNKKGQKPEKLVSDGVEITPKTEDTFLSMAGEEDINRFNKPTAKKRRKKKRNPGNYSPRNQKSRRPKKTGKQ